MHNVPVWASDYATVQHLHEGYCVFIKNLGPGVAEQVKQALKLESLNGLDRQTAVSAAEQATEIGRKELA